MKHALVYPEYVTVCRFAHQSHRDNPDLRQEYYRTLDSIASGYAKGFTPDKISVLLFILNRTLKLGRLVADIPFPAFLGGVTSDTFRRSITSGITISKNTLRKVLKELEEEGILHTFFPAKMRGVIDHFTRYFEIDFKKIQKLTSVGSRIVNMIKTKMETLRENRLNAPKNSRNLAKTTAESASLRLPKLGGLGSKRTHVSLSVMYSDEQPVAPDPIERGAEPEAMPASRTTVRRIVRTVRATEAAAPQDATHVAQVVATVREKLDAIAASAQAKRATKIAEAKKITAKNVQMHQLQAIVDDVMARFYPELPRMAVTGKPFGALKNHLKRSAPADVADFLKWTLCAWPRLAQDSARKARRDSTTAEGRAKPQYAALPSAPHFATLAFKLPFFLACYNNQQAINGKMGAPDTRKDDEIAKLKKAVVHAHQAIQSAERVAVKAARTRQERDSTVTFTHRAPVRGAGVTGATAAAKPPPARAQDQDDADLFDELPPMWK